MDITDTVAPKSDQQNYDDYLTGPRTVTISGVKVIKGEQPVHIELEEFPGRPYKPNKSMRRVLVHAWGDKSAAYVGRSLTLVGNPDVSYGGKKVGGIEIAAMSHIDKPLSLALTETRGKKKSFTVQTLAAPAPRRDWLTEAAQAGGDTDNIKALWYAAQQAGEPQEVLDSIRAHAS
ncbi:hypothetical protein [Paenarthrobacter sp. NPDC018779]|uniref:hypothetical protein n=1 Tax=Paenarthrobacter sp. NPDC018779 TaxID=3364375 RepID=UPI0037C68A8A